MARSNDPRMRGRRRSGNPVQKSQKTNQEKDKAEVASSQKKSTSPRVENTKGKTYRAAPSVLNLIFWLLMLVFFYWFFEIQLAWPAWWSVASVPIFFIARFFYLALRSFRLNSHDTGIHFFVKILEIPYMSIRSVHTENSTLWQRLFWGAAQKRVFIAYNKYDYARFSVQEQKKFQEQLSQNVPDLSPVAHFEY